MTSQSRWQTAVTRCGLALGALAAMLLVVVGPAGALDLGEWVQGLRLTPFLSERFEYESNVFQVASRSKDDLIIKTIPGLLLEYGSGPNWMSLGYRAEILTFLSSRRNHRPFHRKFHHSIHHINLARRPGPRSSRRGNRNRKPCRGLLRIPVQRFVLQYFERCYD